MTRRTHRRIGTNRKYKYPLNENVFDSPTPEGAYWIGFIMADGHVSQDNRIWLTQKSSRRYHLKEYAAFLETDTPISNLKDGCSRIVFTSAYVREVLSRYGISGQKSLTAKVVGLENDPDFWRGVIDGDGCVRRRGDGFASLFVVGSAPLMGQFQCFARSVAKTRAKAYPYKDCNLSRLVLSGGPAVEVLDCVYSRPGPVLHEKAIIAMELIGRDA